MTDVRPYNMPCNNSRAERGETIGFVIISMFRWFLMLNTVKKIKIKITGFHQWLAESYSSGEPTEEDCVELTARDVLELHDYIVSHCSISKGIDRDDCRHEHTRSSRQLLLIMNRCSKPSAVYSTIDYSKLHETASAAYRCASC